MLNQLLRDFSSILCKSTCLNLLMVLQDLAFKSEQEKAKLVSRGGRGHELQEIKRELELAYKEQFKQLTAMVRFTF